jgi:translation machinery-associated protein 16
MSVCSF